MAQMKSGKPARKVTFSSISAAAATLIVYLLNEYVFKGQDPMSVTEAAALATVITFLVGYYVPPHRDDGLDEDSIGDRTPNPASGAAG